MPDLIGHPQDHQSVGLVLLAQRLDARHLTESGHIALATVDDHEVVARSGEMIDFHATKVRTIPWKSKRIRFFVPDQMEAFLEDEGEGFYAAAGAGIVERVFFPFLQTGYDGGHFCHPAHAVSGRAVFFIDAVKDGVPFDRDIAGDSVEFDGAVHRRIRAGDAQVAVFVFQGKQGDV